MPSIAPCVTAADPQMYREQMARIQPFAHRVHIDFSDGEFAPQKLLNPAHAYWPEKLTADLHLMYKRPLEQLETVISLRPNLVIIHAEAEGELVAMLLELRSAGIKSGVALLQSTMPEEHPDLIAAADHVLIFSGDLGHYGGKADMTLLKKVAGIRVYNATAELGWDGGVTSENAPLLLAGGVEVLDIGGFIQRADDPKAAYTSVVSLV